MARWFRFYDDALNDPKVQKLPAALFKTWVNLLCLASANDGALGTLDDIAFGLRLSLKETTRAMQALEDAGLVDRRQHPRGDILEPHNWHGRQYSSDSSAERMRRHRERKRDGAETSPVTANGRHIDRHSDAAEQNRTDSDTEQSRTEQTTASPEAPPTRGSRLGIATLPEDWRAFCKQERPELDPERVFIEFRDYWAAVPGQRGRKLDWFATWRNRVREVKAPRASLFEPPKPATLEEVKTWGRS